MLLERRTTLERHQDLSVLLQVIDSLHSRRRLLLKLRFNVQVLVHLLGIVILDLILEVVEQEHLWLVQPFDDAFHFCGTTLELSSRVRTELVS